MNNSTALFLIVLSLGLFYTFTKPQYEQMQALRVSASEHRAVLDNLERIAAKRAELFDDYAAFPRFDLERLNKLLPEQVDTVRLALDLDTLAGRSGITLKNVSLEAGSDDASAAVIMSDGKPYEELIATFSFIATYSNFRQFLEDLEKSLRIMDVNSVTFQTGEADLAEYQVSVKTYFLK